MKLSRISSRLARSAAALALGAALLASPALGQDSSASKKKETVLVPPAPPLGKSDTPWTPIGVAVLLLLIIVGVNFIPSKRGHQD
jgi:hypothetical protein